MSELAGRVGQQRNRRGVLRQDHQRVGWEDGSYVGVPQDALIAHVAGDQSNLFEATTLPTQPGREGMPEPVEAQPWFSRGHTPLFGLDSASGRITGTPTQAGTYYPVRIIANNEIGPRTEDYEIVIENAGANGDAVFSSGFE